MLDKIKNLFAAKGEGDYVSALHFRDDIRALGMETYKNITIIYLSKPGKNSEDRQPIYHIFHKNKFYAGEGDTYESLQNMARSAIDNNFKDF